MPGKDVRYVVQEMTKETLRQAGVDPSHGGDAAQKRGATMRRRMQELSEWNAAHDTESAKPEIFEREILPRIRSVPLSDLVRATGLTHAYLSQVRRGVKTPHPRHWPALMHATRVG
jgi:hypothetical protein